MAGGMRRQRLANGGTYIGFPVGHYARSSLWVGARRRTMEGCDIPYALFEALYSQLKALTVRPDFVVQVSA
jgi:hypothetical protein